MTPTACTVCGTPAPPLPSDDAARYAAADAAGWRLRQTFGMWDAYCSQACAARHGYAA